MPLRSNNHSEELDERMKKQVEGQAHSANLQDGSPWQEGGELKAQYLEALTESSLDDGTIDIMKNMLSRDFVLGYVTSAENTEFTWLTRVLKLKIIAMHPPPESVISGSYRAYLTDDPGNILEPLSDRQRAEIDQFVRGVLWRASRSKDGWQQQKLSESIKVSEIRDNDETSGGGIRGMLNRR